MRYVVLYIVIMFVLGYFIKDKEEDLLEGAFQANLILLFISLTTFIIYLSIKYW